MTDRSQVDNTTALIAEFRAQELYCEELHGQIALTYADRLADALEAVTAELALTRRELATWVEEGRARGEQLEAVTVERDSLSALHEVATERTVQLAAVIAEAQEAWEASTGWHEFGETVSRILNRAPGDVLREHDAALVESIADEYWNDGYAESTYTTTISGELRERAAALRVGANPQENEHG